MLSPGGRAAIIVPDNVLFEDGRGRLLREYLLDECDLHTLLRLPTGIFYAQGVKTNIIFFEKSKKTKSRVGGTKELWIYDLRTNLPTFGKTNPLGSERFEEFIELYAEGAKSSSTRVDQGVGGRFRKFTRDELRARGDNLDIVWLRDELTDPDFDLDEPEELTAAIVDHLRSALAELESIAEEVDEDRIEELAKVANE